MSKLMYVLGIILLAAGVALLVLWLVNSAPLQARGVDLATTVNLLIGGVLAIGLAGVIGAIGKASAESFVQEEAPAIVSTVDEQPAPVEEEPASPAKTTLTFPSFGRKAEAPAASAAAATAAIGAAAEAKPELSPSVKETITALEKAKTELQTAFDEKPAAPEAASAEEADAEPEVAGDGELYVVEDKMVRGRPARILSDGTVEAETEEGWMRFENLEHLDEYLDAVEQA